MPTTHAVTPGTLLRPMLVAVVTLALTVLPAAAADPDSPLGGIWFIAEADFGVGPNPYYVSFHQNDNLVVGILLDPTLGEWIYIVGTRTGSAVAGAVYFWDGEPFGTTFSLTVTEPTVLTGQSDIDGLLTPLSGTKLF